MASIADKMDKYKLDMTGYPKTYPRLDQNGLVEVTEDIMDSIRSQVTWINGHVVWTPEERERKFHYKQTTHMLYRVQLYRVLTKGPMDSRLAILKTLRTCHHGRLPGSDRFSEFSLALLKDWIRQSISIL